MSPSTTVIQFKKYLLGNIIHPICNLKGLNEIISNSSLNASILSNSVIQSKRLLLFVFAEQWILSQTAAGTVQSSDAVEQTGSGGVARRGFTKRRGCDDHTAILESR